MTQAVHTDYCPVCGSAQANENCAWCRSHRGGAAGSASSRTPPARSAPLSRIAARAHSRGTPARQHAAPAEPAASRAHWVLPMPYAPADAWIDGPNRRPSDPFKFGSSSISVHRRGRAGLPQIRGSFNSPKEMWR